MLIINRKELENGLRAENRVNVNRTYANHYATIEFVHKDANTDSNTLTAYEIYQSFMYHIKDVNSDLRKESTLKNIDLTFEPRINSESENDEFLLYPSTFVFHYNAKKSITQHQSILASPGYANKTFEMYKMEVDDNKLWLNVNPKSGVIKGGEALEIDIIVDFKKLENNLDYSTIKIYHNGNIKKMSTISIMAFKGELEYKSEIKEDDDFWTRLWSYRLEDDAVSTSISALVMILVLEVFIFIFYYCCCSVYIYIYYLLFILYLILFIIIIYYVNSYVLIINMNILDMRRMK